MAAEHDTVRPIEWRDDALHLLDQRLLPAETTWLTYTDAPTVAAAIHDLVVRGAPAIGITAAYAVVLSVQQHGDDLGAINRDLELLAVARPTAVNLVWALERMRAVLQAADGDPLPALLREAQTIHAEDIAANYAMGKLGADLIGADQAALTWCNAGSLATGGYGTALGVIRSAWSAGKLREVYAGETRPWLQGARLTAWELLEDQIPVQLIADSTGAYLMRSGKVDWVITGADRVTANGDVINKIGTYQMAVNCRHHGLKMMVVAPTSTLDYNLDSGDDVPIETRLPEEILELGGQRVAAPGAAAWNPVFDITPAALVDYLVTEKGVVAAPDRAGLAALRDSA